jgi:hypothetical protein
MASPGIPLAKAWKIRTSESLGKQSNSLWSKASMPNTLRTIEVKSEVSGWVEFTLLSLQRPLIFKASNPDFSRRLSSSRMLLMFPSSFLASPWR